MIDEQKTRREFTRWGLVKALYNAHPLGAAEEHLLAIIQGVYPDATQRELRRELDYLFDRKLIEVEKQPDGRWRATIARYGVDLAEYNIACEPGIARPDKYF